DHGQRLAELRERRAASQAALKELEARLANERALVEELRALRGKLEAHAAAAADPAKAKDRLSAADEQKARADLAAKQKALADLQGEHPLVQPFVTSQAVAEVVSGWTGIPIGKMVRNEIQAVLGLKDRLAERV